jgi:hypothetical protein
LASLLALLGDESLDNALETESGAWLTFQWQPPIADMLTRYYDWHFELGIKSHRGRCSSCLRRIAYLPDEQSDQETAILQLERRPGSRA